MWMTKRDQLAVCAMLALATQKESGCLALPLLAQRLGVSLTHFEDIFSRLRQFGLVSGLRGRNGGYVLARDPGSITIAEIVLAIDALPRWASCEKVAIESPFVDDRAELWNAVGEHALAFLGSITLGALAEKWDAQQGKSRRAGRISPLRCRVKSPMPQAPNSVFELANYSRVATS